jgi:hypothetical protein
MHECKNLILQYFKDAKSRKDSIEESKACLLASCTGMMLTCKRKKKKCWGFSVTTCHKESRSLGMLFCREVICSG